MLQSLILSSLVPCLAVTIVCLTMCLYTHVIGVVSHTYMVVSCRYLSNSLPPPPPPPHTHTHTWLLHAELALRKQYSILQQQHCVSTARNITPNLVLRQVIQSSPFLCPFFLQCNLLTSFCRYPPFFPLTTISTALENMSLHLGYSKLAS